MSDLGEMTGRHAQPGRLVWIGLRPARRAAMRAVAAAQVGPAGLDGDHAGAGPRAVTLLQAEHLAVIGALLGRPPVPPEALRRNLVVAGINLAALRHWTCRIGGVLLRPGKLCAPCSRMEETLDHGGYSAVRGHGGFYAEVLAPGRLRLGDAVTAAPRDGADGDGAAGPDVAGPRGGR
ncbi:MOSC domain-containing protein [Roseivivax sp. CAU 1761]